MVFQDWEAFRLLTNQELDEINWNTEVDHLNFSICCDILQDKYGQ